MKHKQWALHLNAGKIYVAGREDKLDLLKQRVLSSSVPWTSLSPNIKIDQQDLRYASNSKSWLWEVEPLGLAGYVMPRLE
jgi:hypothetical protein